MNYFKARGYPDEMAGNILNNIKPHPSPEIFQGSTKEVGANRVVFGEAVNLVLDTLSKEEAAKKVLVIDSAHAFVFFVAAVNLSEMILKAIWRAPRALK